MKKNRSKTIIIIMAIVAAAAVISGAVTVKYIHKKKGENQTEQVTAEERENNEAIKDTEDIKQPEDKTNAVAEFVLKGNEKTGTIIEFGSYPQSKVTDSVTVSELENVSKNWISYDYYSGTGESDNGQMKSSDYMKYADISYNGNKYRAVTFSKYRPIYTYCDNSENNSDANSYTQSSNGYYKDNVYYFKFEPLKWKVLDPDEGLVLCESIVDSQAFNNYILYSNNCSWGDSAKTYYAADYGRSSIRAWLNNDFYNTAFSAEEKEQIKQNVTIESKDIKDSGFVGTTTNDNKVFLLSEDDLLNSEYGFSSSPEESDSAKRKTSTDYSQCQGSWIIDKNDAHCAWSLRTVECQGLMFVHSDGYVCGSDPDPTPLNYVYSGVCPALMLKK